VPSDSAAIAQVPNPASSLACHDFPEERIIVPWSRIKCGSLHDPHRTTVRTSMRNAKEFSENKKNVIQRKDYFPTYKASYRNFTNTMLRRFAHVEIIL
jgi:hypothetical protein